MDTKEALHLASELVSKEHDCLIAHFIVKNPNIPLDKIEICQMLEADGTIRVWVRERASEALV